jgi:hypothetical protein
VSGPNLDETTLAEPTIEVFRGGKQFAFMFSWDDEGNDLNFSFQEDALGFRHTTFGVTRRLLVKRLWGLDQLFRGHDIQSHSREHLHHASLNESYREYLISQSVLDITDAFGYRPILFAYPYGSQTAACQRQVLKYFKVARGIYFESGSDRGGWPIVDVGNCLHSYPSIDGVRGTNMDRLVSSFTEMVSESDGQYRAFKCYGHSKWFTPEQITEFFQILREIAFRNDTWYTSWGEAVAYQLQRDNVHVQRFSFNGRALSFQTVIDSEFEYGIPITYKIQIPSHWDTAMVLDDGRLSDRFRIAIEENRKYVFLDSAPCGQTIRIVTEFPADNTRPEIRNLRSIVTESGVAFLADVEDEMSFISDVNITIRGGNQAFTFQNVENPIFWANSTYGRVVFNLAPGCYWFEIDALDAFGNKATQGTYIYFSSESF